MAWYAQHCNPQEMMPFALADHARNSGAAQRGRPKTNRKPYRCDIPGCTKAFAQKNNLETHRRAHTGECPYVSSFLLSRARPLLHDLDADWTGLPILARMQCSIHPTRQPQGKIPSARPCFGSECLLSVDTHTPPPRNKALQVSRVPKAFRPALECQGTHEDPRESARAVRLQAGQL